MLPPTARKRHFPRGLVIRGTAARIPAKAKRKVKLPHDRTLYRTCHKIEIMFGRLNDWRRIYTRYDQCQHTFMAAIHIAAIVIFWLNQ